ncbi:polyprenyl synthetase family protein [Arenivirga flava]|uniref:polyprenyl synthetase family protein n=1 Tax=Arenivirga flava TaxID=1930060 RepID=UPI0024E13C93|nr:polyprenyl synthetase family protein [Arenivirga flava]
MAESLRLVDRVQHCIDDFLEQKTGELARIAPELVDLTRFSGDLLRGGKRFRALFSYWGWQSVQPAPVGLDAPDPVALDAIVEVCAALELFHAAALVHDDIIDRSDTRRGLPASHRRFEQLHREGAWSGETEQFGLGGGMLLGDLLLAWSDEILLRGLQRLGPARTASARAEFDRMRTEVTVGQYLDILEEAAWMHAPESTLADRAARVVLYKSAKYSVEAPLVIGASLGGGSPEQVQALRDFGIPLGIAFQLRDDLLGVFGDPAVTGKPAGDDLREGKRTVLIALAREALPSGARRLLDEMLGDPDLDDAQVEVIRASLRESGAVAEIERRIEAGLRDALDGLAAAPLSRSARDELRRLGEAVIRREA